MMMEMEEEVIGSECLECIQFSASAMAISWQKQGHPDLNFLTEIGLHCLAEVKWEVFSSRRIEEFISNFNLSRSESTVTGRRFKFTPHLIARSFGVPNEGYRILIHPPPDLKFINNNSTGASRYFKEDAYVSDVGGFRNNMTVSVSMTCMLHMIGEVVQLQQECTHTSAYFVDIIERARMGTKMNWPLFLYDNIIDKLKQIKENAKKGITLLFSAGPLINHILSFADLSAIATSLDDGDTTAYTTTTSDDPTTAAAAAASEILSEEDEEEKMKKKVMESLNEMWESEKKRKKRAEDELTAARRKIEKLRNSNRRLRKRKNGFKEMQANLLKNIQALETAQSEMTVTVTALRTELAAKEYSFGSHIWESVQMEVWKQTREAHTKLVATITDLSNELQHTKSLLSR